VAKNILVFADGTGNESGLLPDESRTNVYKFFRATRTGPDTTIDPEKQIAFYIPGVGTPGVTPPSIWKRIWKGIEQAVGGGLTAQILNCYAAIVSVWAPGDLHAQTLDRAIWDPTSDPSLSGISSLVAVHRLREVACLYGFTRFEPAPLANEDLEDVGLAVNGAALGQNPEWLPAVEQYGEGFFIRFSSEAFAQWLVRPAVMERAQQLQAGATAWVEAKRSRGMAVSANVLNERERPEYIMAHSLAHALMTEVAIDCGYPASALKERIYLLSASSRTADPVRHLDLYRDRGKPGDTRRSSRSHPSFLPGFEVCS
jgi:hypothetical protein